MYENKRKIFSIILFSFLFMAIILLISINPKNKTGGNIKVIEITGNKLMSSNDYIKFIYNNRTKPIHTFNLSILKDRVLKHPYVANADIEFVEDEKARVNIKEKKITAILLSKGDPLFLTDESEVVPILSNSRFSSIPIISNPKNIEEVKPLTIIKSNDLSDAIRIIDAIRYSDRKMLLSLSEINLRNGGDIILTFSGIKPPVIFGRGETARKIIYLETLWANLLRGEMLVNNSSYIDLRFANKIYVGKSEKIGYKQ
ncbi:MAG: FtsQ-type POTRA domain-containing protein [Bacteroidetes bacterium]|nr:FtsQ-type POTRA domain-containing protein [Bacteroidota bacterium]